MIAPFFVPTGFMTTYAAKFSIYKHLYLPSQYDTVLHQDIEREIQDKSYKIQELIRNGFSEIPELEARHFRAQPQRPGSFGSKSKIETKEEFVARYVRRQESVLNLAKNRLQEITTGNLDFGVLLFANLKGQGFIDDGLSTVKRERHRDIFRLMRQDLFDGRVNAYFVSKTTGVTPFPNRFIWSDNAIAQGMYEHGNSNPFDHGQSQASNRVSVFFKRAEVAERYPLKRFDPNPNKRKVTKTERIESAIISAFPEGPPNDLGIARLRQMLESDLDEMLSGTTVRRARDNVWKRLGKK